MLPSLMYCVHMQKQFHNNHCNHCYISLYHLRELIPKRFGLLRAERIAKLAAEPMRIFSKITHPFVWLLNKTSNLFFSLFNIKRSPIDAVTEEEIKTIISEGTEAGTIEEEEKEID